jgi:hypothetical protein
MGKNALFGAAFYEWDFSVSEKWRLRDRVGVQFRAEYFNFLNNRTYAGAGSPTNPVTFGLATSAPNASNPINRTGATRSTVGLESDLLSGCVADRAIFGFRSLLYCPETLVNKAFG